uniref:Major facilitator superfamily (MFS) profile domain-containing protein n=1 Tax=Plectus sambesii TaxID=2011161 RepID=A0A914WXG9_9BILA
MGKITDFEQVFAMSKHYGWYQLFMLLVIQYTCINSAGNFLFISFAGLKPFCAVPVAVTDVCDVIRECPANNTMSIFYSLYDEGIACPNSNLPNHMQTLMSIASGFGALAGGHLADIYGRKWVAYSGLVGMVVFGMVTGAVTTWPMLALCMIAMGLSYGVAIDACMTLASETVGRKHRIVQTFAFQWSLAFQFVSLTAYLSGSWHKYIVIVNACCIPILVLTLFWVESPRWLIQQKRYHDAAVALNTICRWNRCAVRFRKEQLIDIDIDANKERTSYSVLDLFSSKKLTLYSIVMIASALTVEMTGIVILFNTQALAGSPFLNVALYGLLRIWVPAFVVFMDSKADWFGRRTMFLGAQGITISAFASVILIYALGLQHDWQVLMTFLAMIGGVINSSIFFTVYKQYVIELYPTVMRGMAIGAFGVVERVGGALAPQLLILNSVWEGSAFTGAILIIAVSSVLGAIILPETRNRSMPDSFKSATQHDAITAAKQDDSIREPNH